MIGKPRPTDIAGEDESSRVRPFGTVEHHRR